MDSPKRGFLEKDLAVRMGSKPPPERLLTEGRTSTRRIGLIGSKRRSTGVLRGVTALQASRARDERFDHPNLVLGQSDLTWVKRARKYGSSPSVGPGYDVGPFALPE